jgi:hypothetical protein
MQWRNGWIAFTMSQWVRLRTENRSLMKLVYVREFEGDEARRTAVYLLVHEDSSN